MEDEATPSTAEPAAWRVAHLSALFVFDIACISRGGGDLLEPLVLTAVLQANQAPLLADAEQQLQYGAPEAPLPDGARRPISINAVAQSLGLPFETVRRRAKALAARGVCVIADAGIYVPQAAVVSPAYLTLLTQRAARLARFGAELADAGLQPKAAEAAAVTEVAPRAADRLLANYMLRACRGLLAFAGGAVDGMVLLALAAANLRDVPVWSTTHEAALRQRVAPCPATALAAALGMPDETVRRHLHRLAARGFCERSVGGWAACVPPTARAALVALVRENAHNVRRLFADLDELRLRAASGEDSCALIS